MRTRQLAVISGLIFMFAVLFTPAARADEWNEATRLTFNQPMEIPGHKILAAGTYWFVNMADFAARNVVQIFSADRTKVIATIPTIAVERAQRFWNTEVDFAKPEAAGPNALVNWYYPGETTGHEFLYSRQEQRMIESEPLTKVMATSAVNG